MQRDVHDLKGGVCNPGKFVLLVRLCLCADRLNSRETLLTYCETLRVWLALNMAAPTLPA